VSERTVAVGRADLVYHSPAEFRTVPGMDILPVDAAEALGAHPCTSCFDRSFRDRRYELIDIGGHA
jgi:hypothetical protein